VLLFGRCDVHRILRRLLRIRQQQIWWLSGGIAPATCLAAYTPKGAASLAVSYDNQATALNGLPDGTYDITVNNPTGWSASAGWIFSKTGGASDVQRDLHFAGLQCNCSI
jgi:hypothetical protein